MNINASQVQAKCIYQNRNKTLSTNLQVPILLYSPLLLPKHHLRDIQLVYYVTVATTRNKARFHAAEVLGVHGPLFLPWSLVPR